MMPKYVFDELEKFGKRHGRFKAGQVLKNALLAAMFEAQGRIADEFLSAPGRAPEPNPYENKLRVDTGRLRSDFLANTPKAKKRGGRLIGEMGTKVEYAAVHEFGFSGQVQIGQHWRTIKSAFGRKIAPRSVLIKTHLRNMKVKERAPFRSGLRASHPKMAEIVADFVVAEMRRAIGYK